MFTLCLSFLIASSQTCDFCFGSDATLTANGSGGSGTGYTYSWSTGASTQSITVTAGVYTVTLTDSNNCDATATFTVSQLTMIDLVCTGMDNESCGTPNGSATVVASGGSGTGYMYAWSNGGSTQTITGLTGDLYTVTVTDSNGCTNSCSVEIDDELDAPSVTITCTPN